MESGKTCATCAGLVRLCGGLDFFPSDIEVRRLLAERLHRLARNHQHASRMIDTWLERETVAPKIPDLVRLANDVRAESETLPDGCEVCGGEAWVVDDRGARRCNCARGQSLRQADRSRETTAVQGVSNRMERVGAVGPRVAASRDIGAT
jgi:hypothetical protein